MKPLPHVQNGAKFDERKALGLAAAADLAYCKPPKIEDTLRRQWGFDAVEFFDVDGTECFFAYDRTDAIVSFRGTEVNEVADWITDLDFDLVKGPLGGKVHEGFYDALSNVWRLIDARVRRLGKGEPKSLWVTGHSLGGALATLATARWIERGHQVAGLYTFGQPRVGDAVFARNFDFAFKPYAFRIVNNNDIVTRVPPRAMGYRHLGRFRYLTESAELMEDIGFWDLFLDRCRGKVEDILEWGDDGIKDHSMTMYRQLLGTAIGRGQRVLEKIEEVHRQTVRRIEAELIRPRRRAA